MLLILAEDKEGHGRYINLDLSKESILPNIHGIRIQEITITSKDIHWLRTYDIGPKWLNQIVFTKMVPYNG